MTDQSYNGWSNYETWCVNLWLTNEEGSDSYCRELAQQCIEDAFDEDNDDATIQDAATQAMAGQLESYHDEFMPEVSGVFKDLLMASLGAVNWHEIASNFVAEVEIKRVAA
jgi:hypothetical protein